MKMDERIYAALNEILIQMQIEAQDGPSLRDQFAMAALAGMFANPEIDFDYGPGAESAYKQADAMLRARAAKGEGRT